jgi:hypothetical protein
MPKRLNPHMPKPPRLSLILQAAPGAARAEEETLRELQEWQRERQSEERERGERARESERERESERARREDKTLAQR